MANGDQKVLGLGVIGLHEGRTMLTGLSHTAPGPIGGSRPLEPGETARATHVRAVGGCDLEQAKIELTRGACPHLKYTQDYDEMLSWPEIDIVAVYTPDSHHVDHIVRAFEAGKHVICTKPLVNSLEDAAKILQAGRRTGMRLMVGQSTRFFEPFRRQRRDVEAGQMGDIEFVDAQYCHRMDWFYEKSPWSKDTTDWVFLGMSHPIDLIRWYLGRIKTVQAVGFQSALSRRFDAKGFDIYSAQFTAEDGRIGRAYAHYGLKELPSARNAIELMLYGSDGTSLAQYHDMRYKRTGDEGQEIMEDFLYEWRGYYFNNEVHGMHYGEFSNLADYFAQQIITGQPNSPDLEEGVETVCVMEAVKLSAQTGQPIELAPLLAKAGL